MYTPGQLSEMLHISPSSLRRISTEFSAFLDPQKQRHRRYSDRDVHVISKVREMTGEGQSFAEIRRILPMVLTDSPEKPAPDSLAKVPEVAADLERLDALARNVQKALDDLQAAHNADHARLVRLEEWVSLPWYKRLFTPPPS